MRARLARLALLSALVVVVGCVAGYLMSGPTDAATSGPFAQVAWEQEGAASAERGVTTLPDRERPAQRPVRSDYEDPARRVRASSLEALLQRTDDSVHN